MMAMHRSRSISLSHLRPDEGMLKLDRRVELSKYRMIDEFREMVTDAEFNKDNANVNQSGSERMRNRRDCSDDNCR